MRGVLPPRPSHPSKEFVRVFEGLSNTLSFDPTSLRQALQSAAEGKLTMEAYELADWTNTMDERIRTMFSHVVREKR